MVWRKKYIKWEVWKEVECLVNACKQSKGLLDVSFGDVCSEIEFIQACSGKIVISLSRVDILRIKVEEIKKICWGWFG